MSDARFSPDGELSTFTESQLKNLPIVGIDANGYWWRVWPENPYWSMVPVNPDNSPIPTPVTFFRLVPIAKGGSGE